MSLDETFPKRYEPKAVEPKWHQEWEKRKPYRFDEAWAAREPQKVYSIDTPPPTVSGRLHIGHVFSYTHTEIVSRFKRMRGLNVYYPFGYDDNGLPTELLTEKELGIKSYQTPRSEFRQKCLEVGTKYAQLFSHLWKTLGFSCDFDSAYSTISKDSQKISQWSFVDLHEKNKLDRRHEPALWCVKCATSFAQAEIDDINKASEYLHIPFEVAGLPALTVATTRPELLPACVSVFVHPDDDRFKNYVGKKAKVPFFNYEVPVIADDKALMTKGTGVVMCCTFGDTTDIAWYRQHKLPLREAISKIGKMTEICGPIVGLTIEAARKKMVELLTEQNLLLKRVPINEAERVVNTHERCGTPVEYLVQPQWFIKVCESQNELIAMGRKVKWHPDFMRGRFENWVQNLSWDWAISRQRAFGVPIPAWYSSKGNHVYVAQKKDLPVDPVESKPPVKCPEGEWIGDADVMDTWATSSATPLINARFSLENERKHFLPMSMRPQAHDIIRTWAFYTIAKNAFHFKDIPWKDAVISGHVKKPGTEVAATQVEGQQFAKKTKISKSKDGEKYAPERILEANGADAVRLWSAGASLGTDILFDENGMADANKFLNKLWNATRFAVMQLEGFTPSKTNRRVNVEDEWIHSSLQRVLAYFLRSFDDYDIHRGKVELDKFFWMNLCDNYIEYVKCRLATATPEQKLSSQQTLYDTLFTVLKMYAPFAPHVTEEIYHVYFKQFEELESIHNHQIQNAEGFSEKVLTQGELIVTVISAIRTFKSKNQLGFRVPAESLTINTSKESADLLTDALPVIQNFASAAKIEVVTEGSGDHWFASSQEGTSIYLKL